MSAYTYTITIICETEDEASTVISERLGFDENYGFTYSLDFTQTSAEEVTE